jgi:hypothetical protein
LHWFYSGLGLLLNDLVVIHRLDRRLFHSWQRVGKNFEFTGVAVTFYSQLVAPQLSMFKELQSQSLVLFNGDGVDFAH